MSRASEIAYQKIRSLLIHGWIQPGIQLTEEKLSKISGVSRTPVREAVKRLENEMLLVRIAYKRLTVADWTDKELTEMFTLRTMIEIYTAGRAAARIDKVTLDKLREINDELKHAVNKPVPDISSFLQANRRFHDVILECARSPFLSNILPALVEQPVVRRTAHQNSRSQLNRSTSDHDELIVAFAAHDENWAKAIMTRHIRRVFHTSSNAVTHENSSC